MRPKHETFDNFESFLATSANNIQEVADNTSNQGDYIKVSVINNQLVESKALRQIIKKLLTITNEAAQPIRTSLIMESQNLKALAMRSNNELESLRHIGYCTSTPHLNSRGQNIRNEHILKEDEIWPAFDANWAEINSPYTQINEISIKGSTYEQDHLIDIADQTMELVSETNNESRALIHLFRNYYHLVAQGKTRDSEIYHMSDREIKSIIRSYEREQDMEDLQQVVDIARARQEGNYGHHPQQRGGYIEPARGYGNYTLRLPHVKWDK